MKNWSVALLLALALALLPQAQVQAAGGPPVGGCAPGFELHEWMLHDGHDGHRHIGIKQDLNGDGWICMKMVADGTLHVHVDNVRPLR